MRVRLALFGRQRRPVDVVPAGPEAPAALVVDVREDVRDGGARLVREDGGEVVADVQVVVAQAREPPQGVRGDVVDVPVAGTPAVGQPGGAARLQGPFGRGAEFGEHLQGAAHEAVVAEQLVRGERRDVQVPHPGTLVTLGPVPHLVLHAKPQRVAAEVVRARDQVVAARERALLRRGEAHVLRFHGREHGGPVRREDLYARVPPAGRGRREALPFPDRDDVREAAPVPVEFPSGLRGGDGERHLAARDDPHAHPREGLGARVEHHAWRARLVQFEPLVGDRGVRVTYVLPQPTRAGPAEVRQGGRPGGGRVEGEVAAGVLFGHAETAAEIEHGGPGSGPALPAVAEPQEVVGRVARQSPRFRPHPVEGPRVARVVEVVAGAPAVLRVAPHRPRVVRPREPT